MDIILKKCKEHNGPLISLQDVACLCNSIKDKKTLTVLRTELQYQKFIHVKDAQERPELYKVNNLNEEEMMINLMALFPGDCVNGNNQST